MKHFLEWVQQIGESQRTSANVVRRVLKTTEEVGELAEAALSVTSESNAKDKRWIHVIEEAVDVAIMGLDVALTKPETGFTDEEWQRVVYAMFAQKLHKWELQAKGSRTLIPEKLPTFDDEDNQVFIDLIARQQELGA